MYYTKKDETEGLPLSPTSVTPAPKGNAGRLTDPNPGERSAQASSRSVQRNSLGMIPSRGNRAGGGQFIDAGAQVGIKRNLEFTAGGRSHRISTGTHSHNQPAYDPKTGELHVSTASDSGDSTIGAKSPSAAKPAMPPEVPGAGATNDTTSGDTSPDRRRDKDTT